MFNVIRLHNTPTERYHSILVYQGDVVTITPRFYKSRFWKEGFRLMPFPVLTVVNWFCVTGLNFSVISSPTKCK